MRKTYKLSAALVLLFLSVGWSFAQYTVTGVVTDSRTGEPLIGANILVRNTTMGTVANLDGRFTLNLNSSNEAVLVISSLGYLSQTFTVNPTNNNLQVALREDATNLEEVVITGLASQHVKNLNSFSIGYADEPLFDETHYANLVAKKFKTEHTVFKLSNQNLFEQLDKVLEYTDEPFADSSGLAVNILCELTKKNVTVALSGDGADEVFSGYNKHLALFQANQKTAKNTIIKSIHPLTSVLPQSRNSKIGNLNRQLAKFGEGLRLNHIDRYWLWAGLRNEDENNKLIIPHTKHYKERKDEILKYLQSPNDFNQVLLTDCKLVLQGDMLTKVDLNSMCQSLEVRVPFLDHRVVNFAFQLPSKYKIDGTFKKKIVQDAFRDFLPKELYKRPKHGFEVPLLNWFKTDMYDKIFNQYLHPSFIIEQNIFEWAEVEKLRKKLLSNSPEDSTATIWALVVFQHWYKKYML